MGFVDNDAFSL